MKKRIKNKIIKRNNTKRIENILTEITKYFTISNKIFGNFIMGNNSECYFYLKETPNWKYGIWLLNDKNFNLFGEHINLISKFKPSRTYISCKYDIKEFVNIVGEISKNLKLYFVDSLTAGNALVAYEKYISENNKDDSYYIGYQCVSREFNKKTQLWECLKDETITQKDFVNKEYQKYINKEKKRIEDEEFDRKYAFDFFKELPNLFDEIIEIGINVKNMDTSLRYDIKVVLNKDIIKNMTNDAWIKFSEQLLKLINEKNCSNERRTYTHQFDLTRNCYYRIEKCNYHFYKNNKGGN